MWKKGDGVRLLGEWKTFKKQKDLKTLSRLFLETKTLKTPSE